MNKTTFPLRLPSHLPVQYFFFKPVFSSLGTGPGCLPIFCPLLLTTPTLFLLSFPGREEGPAGLRSTISMLKGFIFQLQNTRCFTYYHWISLKEKCHVGHLRVWKRPPSWVWTLITYTNVIKIWVHPEVLILGHFSFFLLSHNSTHSCL